MPQRTMQICLVRLAQLLEIRVLQGSSESLEKPWRAPCASIQLWFLLLRFFSGLLIFLIIHPSMHSSTQYARYSELVRPEPEKGVLRLMPDMQIAWLAGRCTSARGCDVGPFASQACCASLSVVRAGFRNPRKRDLCPRRCRFGQKLKGLRFSGLCFRPSSREHSSGLWAADFA